MASQVHQQQRKLPPVEHVPRRRIPGRMANYLEPAVQRRDVDVMSDYRQPAIWRPIPGRMANYPNPSPATTASGQASLSDEREPRRECTSSPHRREDAEPRIPASDTYQPSDEESSEIQCLQ
jgi:hypothetical protein